MVDVDVDVILFPFLQRNWKTATDVGCVLTWAHRQKTTLQKMPLTAVKSNYTLFILMRRKQKTDGKFICVFSLLSLVLWCEPSHRCIVICSLLLSSVTIRHSCAYLRLPRLVKVVNFANQIAFMPSHCVFGSQPLKLYRTNDDACFSIAHFSPSSSSSCF